MRTLIILLSILSFTCAGNEITHNFVGLDESYIKFIKNQEYIKALESALELNKIAPDNTQVLLYIVFASIKSNSKLPNWVLDEPWPNANTQDVFNRLLAKQLLDGS